MAIIEIGFKENYIGFFWSKIQNTLHKFIL